MTPRSGVHVCAACEEFSIQIRDATHEEDKVRLSAQFASHVAAREGVLLTLMKAAEAQLAGAQGTAILRSLHV